MTEKFLLDANSFITPYRQYYAFDLTNAFGVKTSDLYYMMRQLGIKI